MKLCKICPSLPVVRKCCFCVEIRKGVTIFGYVNLVLYIISFPQLIYLLVNHQVPTGKTFPDTGYTLHPLTHLYLAIALVVIDALMTVVLLIGVYKKKRILLTVYLYFEIAFQFVTLGIDLVYFDFREYVENSIYFMFLCLNVYLLFLVHNVIRIVDEAASEVQYVSYQDHQQNAL